MAWRIKKFLKKYPQLNNPVMIEGLPGIGNVGKVAVDFMIDQLDAKKLCEITSNSMPHSVFVNEDNIVELPLIEVYYKSFNGKRRDIIFLVGDIQPLDEESCYEFSYTVLDLLKELKGKEMITIGGIGLPAVPEKPKVYCTGNSKEAVKKFKQGIEVNEKLFGVVGPIVGVTGLLVGLAKEKNIDGVCLLAETYGHPLYLGMKGSEKVLDILNKKLSLKMKVKELDEEVKEIEEELMKRTKEMEKTSKKAKKGEEEVSYIG